jgi:hypothetical protein
MNKNIKLELKSERTTLWWFECNKNATVFTGNLKIFKSEGGGF